MGVINVVFCFRHLDISHHNNKFGIFDKSNVILGKIVDGLPNLVSLDISGTNLAGNGVAVRTNCGRMCDIPGLSSRVNRPLRFLGLYGTAFEACRRHDIPAEMVIHFFPQIKKKFFLKRFLKMINLYYNLS